MCPTQEKKFTFYLIPEIFLYYPLHTSLHHTFLPFRVNIVDYFQPEKVNNLFQRNTSLKRTHNLKRSSLNNFEYLCWFV